MTPIRPPTRSLLHWTFNTGPWYFWPRDGRQLIHVLPLWLTLPPPSLWNSCKVKCVVPCTLEAHDVTMAVVTGVPLMDYVGSISGPPGDTISSLPWPHSGSLLPRRFSPWDTVNQIRSNQSLLSKSKDTHIVYTNTNKNTDTDEIDVGSRQQSTYKYPSVNTNSTTLLELLKWTIVPCKANTTLNAWIKLAYLV